MATPDETRDLKIAALREAAATFATTLPEPGEYTDSATTTILLRADRFYGWLVGETRILVRVGPVVGEDSDVTWPKRTARMLEGPVACWLPRAARVHGGSPSRTGAHCSR